MTPSAPFFSVIVPTFERPGPLAGCLRALADLHYPRDRFEIIVVDDGSRTPPEAVVAPFRQQLSVTLLAQSNRGPASARNAGAQHARGEFLAFTDDDCAPAPDWLARLAKRLRATPACLIGGRTLNALRGNSFSSASQSLLDYLYAYYNTVPSQSRFVASNNLALSATGFQAIGGFDTTFPLPGGEDREFCDRWLHRGYGIVYAPEAVVTHTHVLTLRTFWRQHFNYGRGALHFHRLRRQRHPKGTWLQPKTFYLKLLGYPLANRHRRHALFLVALLAVSQGATAAGMSWQMLRNRWSRHD